MERLKRFFTTIVQKAFWELGLAEPPVVEHVGALMAEFARSDRLTRIRTLESRPPEPLDAVRLALPGASARTQIERERDLQCYVADYALFMSGIFRSYAERAGYLNDYFTTGRRSYWAVSEIDASLYRASVTLFQELSRKFEFYSGALDYVRKAYFAPSVGTDPFADFLRQVDAHLRTGISSN